MNQLIYKSIFFCCAFVIFNNVAYSNPDLNLDTKSPTEISESACEWPALVLVEVDKEGPYCDGDYVEVEAFGFSLNGGIPAYYEVSDDYSFFWDGAIEYITQRKVRIQLNSSSESKTIWIKYYLTVDGKTCTDTTSIAFNIIPSKESSIIFEQDKEGPFCDGEVVEVEAFGYSVDGEKIAIDESNEYSFFWKGNIENINENTVKLELDSKLDNHNLGLVYALSQDGHTCFDTSVIAFEVIPKLEPTLNADIFWSPGDTLQLMTEVENLCFQWGKLVDDVETDISEEDENFIATNDDSESIFVSEIVDNEAIPKSTFDDIYFVKIYDCINGASECALIKYFRPDNFQSVELFFESFDYELRILPNPGDGIFTINGNALIDGKDKINMEVYNRYGILVFEQEILTSITTDVLNYNNVPSGLYIIKFTFPDSKVETILYSKF